MTLVEGSAFCLSSRSGEIDPDRPQGLIFRDTRFLSEFRLRLNGNELESLAATTPDPFSGVFVLRGPPAVGRADSHLLVKRRRYVGRGMREDIEISNFGEEPAFCSVEMQFGADFADLFEVKEGRVQKHGKLSISDENGRVTFSYQRGSFRRGDARRLQRAAPPRRRTRHVRSDRAVAGIVEHVHPSHTGARQERDHAALRLRTAGRAVDTRRAPRAVEAPSARGEQ